MKKIIRYVSQASILGMSLTIGLAGNANAAAIISGGNVQLGVDDFGQLNIPGGVASPVSGETDVGLRYLPTGNEATSHGCLCEGWGIADAVLDISGSANNNDGIFGLTLDSFTSTDSTATSITNTTGGEFQVTHDFMPSVTDDLYEVKVTIENTSGSVLEDVRYRRTFDWDIEPDAFSEIVTIGGTEAASAVLFASDDGFASSDPLSFRSDILFTGDAEASGPDDHGALFDFGFGSLDVGGTQEFSIFYGGAATEADAVTALADVGAEVFSFGQAASDPEGLGGVNAAGDALNTFIFGFSGVGGQVVLDPRDPDSDPNPNPDPTPEPATTPEPGSILSLLAVGLVGSRSIFKRKNAAKN